MKLAATGQIISDAVLDSVSSNGTARYVMKFAVITSFSTSGGEEAFTLDFETITFKRV